MSESREDLVKNYIKTNDESLKDDIVLEYKPLVEFIARKLAYNTSDIPDLIQVGNIGLLKSLDNFDISRNIAFSTFASSNIIGEIRHYIRDKGRIVKLPRKLQSVFKNPTIHQNKTQELERFPTTQEIAKDLNLDEKMF